jgi:uncharacterized membrane protein YgcG
MKRLFSALLIALLLVLPVLTTHADNGQYVYVDDDILTAEELETINARAVEIARDRGVGVYYFYYSDVEDLPSYIMQFAAEHVVEENALVFGFSAEYRYALQIGSIAEAALNDDVVDGPLMDAYRAVKGDPQGKLLAFYNAADEALGAYFDTHGQDAAHAAGEPDSETVPDYIALTDGGKPTLVDHAHLLTQNQAEALSIRLKEIGSEYRCDVVIVTVQSLGNKTSEAYADDYFDYNGYGYGAKPNEEGTTIDGDGILLLLAMEDRDFAISTSGYGITAFTDYGIQEYLETSFLPYLSDNDYSRGFSAFADGCEYLLKTARDGIPYDHRRIYIEGWTDYRLLPFNDRAESIANRYGIGIYFLENSVITDADAFAEDFVKNRLLESNAIVLVGGPNGHVILTVGSAAYAKFTAEKFAAVKDAVEPYLGSNDTNGALSAYMDLCSEIISDYAHVLVGNEFNDSQRLSANEQLRALYAEHGIALYFLYDETAQDPKALAEDFLNGETVLEANAAVLGANATGSAVAVRGDLASNKFSARRTAKLVKAIDPYLKANDIPGAFAAFAERGEKILNWRPVNWLTLAIASIAGLLFGFIPANALKRQLTSVNKQTSAEAYMEPSSFTMTQNANVLLGTHTTRSVHVVQQSSSGGGRSGGGGSSFHGGSTTHHSSSGGTHGGHSGKF